MKTKLNNAIIGLKYILFILLLSLKLLAQDIVERNDNYQSFTLENGMKVYLLSSKQSVNTKVSVEVNVGTYFENNENAGISHLLEHLIFRDERVLQNKYVYYLHQEGARYVYGFTGEYITEYLATIESEKSYWLVKTFSDMIFDKKINEHDLEVERSALQTEIGNIKWYHAPLNYLYSFVDWASDIFPSTVEMYEQASFLEKQAPSPHEFYFIENNKKFTLDQLMKHYDKYYYPSNMVLKIAGSFDEQKMKKTIYNSFGLVKKEGTKQAEELLYNSVLNDKK